MQDKNHTNPIQERPRPHNAAVHQVNSTYNEVNSHLRILQKEGIIFDEHFGRSRVIRLNLENPRTLILLEALRILKTAENTKSSEAIAARSNKSTMK
jgi:hypothetical protein